MATIVNNPPPQAPREDGGVGTGMVIGILLIIVIVFLVYWFGFRPNNNAAPANINVQVPAYNQPAPQQPSGTFQSTSTTNSTTTVR